MISDKGWIIENGFKVTKVKIISIHGNLVLMKTENGKTLRLPKHRIYDSEDTARSNLTKQDDISRKSRTPYDYMM